MQTATAHGMSQLTTIIVSSAILMAKPQLANMVVILISFSMAYSMGCAITVGYYYSSRNIEKLSHHHAALLGTQFGGILCYLIMMCKAFEHIH